MRAALAALALAYVMPAYSVIRRMADERDKLELAALRVDGLATMPRAVAADAANALGVPSGEGELQLTSAVSLRLPARCRVELSSVDSTRSAAAVSNNGKRRSDGAELPALQVAADQICGLLALRGAGEGDSREAVARHLAALKVDTKQAALGRFSGLLAYVIGAPAKGSPQLWVYKDDRFHPARVRFTDERGEWDVRFIDYASQATGDWFPRIVEVWKGEQLQLRLTTLSIDARPKLDDKLF